jgi:hypothetical protein
MSAYFDNVSAVELRRSAPHLRADGHERDAKCDGDPFVMCHESLGCAVLAIERRTVAGATSSPDWYADLVSSVTLYIILTFAKRSQDRIYAVAINEF